MRRFIRLHIWPVMLITLALLLTGCGGRATLDPSVVVSAVQATLTALPQPTPQIVEMTRIVEVEITREVIKEVVVTPTPTSTPTQPTLIAAVIAEGWETYDTVRGVSFAYPPTMTLDRETSLLVELSTFGGRTLQVYNDSPEVIQPMESLSQASDRLRQLKRVLVELFPAGVSWPQDERVRQGVLDAPNRPVYIWFAEETEMNWSRPGFATYATNGEQTILLTLRPGNESLQTNPDLLEDLVAMLTNVVRSVEFRTTQP